MTKKTTGKCRDSVETLFYVTTVINRKPAVFKVLKTSTRDEQCVCYVLLLSASRRKAFPGFSSESVCKKLIITAVD